MTEIAHSAAPAAFRQETAQTAAKTPVLTVARRLIMIWSARRRSRIALSRLSPALLRDIGLDRAIAEGEAQRPFWHP